MQHPIFKQAWFFHACIVLAMYLFYTYLWIDKAFLYVGKAGWRGFNLYMFTLFTAPIYIVHHVCLLFIARERKDKQIMAVGLVAIVLCAVQVMAVFSGL